jgi:hypothetical protein
LVSRDVTELFHVARINGNLGTHKILANVNLGKLLIVALPQLPVKPFNALIPASDNFMKGGIGTGVTMERQSFDALQTKSGRSALFLD